MKPIIGALRWLYYFLAEDNLLMLGTIVSLALLFVIVTLGGAIFAGPLFFLFIVLVLFFSLRNAVQRASGK
jgi:hypothetical protein